MAKSTAYIYETDTKDVVAILKSEDQKLIEQVAENLGVDAELHALTYSPAFGCNDGLHDTDALAYDLDCGEVPESL